MQEQVLTLDGAFRHLCKLLDTKGHRVIDVRNINDGRHKLIKTNTNKKLCFIYKRSYFGTYNKQFHNGNQVGESINVDRLWWCMDNNVDWIVFCYPNSHVYCIKPDEFIQFANKHHTYRKLDKKDKVKNYGVEIEVTETTASIDIKELIRWNL